MFSRLTPIFILFIIISCTPTPEELFNDSIETFNQTQDLKSKKYILETILKKSALCSYNIKTINVIDQVKNIQNILLFEDETSKTILTQDCLLSKMALDDIFFSYDEKQKILAASDGFYIKLLNEKNEISKQFKLITDDKISIDALLLHNNILYYFFKRNIYSYSLLTGKKEKLFADKSFSPPFKKNTFKVNLQFDMNKLVVMIGNAGSYNMSVVDLSDQTIIATNIKTTSSRFLFEGDNILYIVGDYENWKIVNYLISDKKTNIVTQLPKITDLNFLSFQEILITIKNKKYLTNMITNNKYTFLPEFDILGNLKNMLIIKFMENFYLVKKNQLIKNLDNIYKLAPAINTIKKK